MPGNLSPPSQPTGESAPGMCMRGCFLKNFSNKSCCDIIGCMEKIFKCKNCGSKLRVDDRETEQFNFYPASPEEPVVYGANRPGYSDTFVQTEEIFTWIDFMKQNNIKRICCLLPGGQLDYYEDDLVSIYRAEFGSSKVLHAPIEDYHLISPACLLNEVLPFLYAADSEKDKTVVHCSGGYGRTGHVMAAWLVHGRGYSMQEACKTVIAMGRDPYEAVTTKNVTEDELYNLFAN